MERRSFTREYPSGDGRDLLYEPQDDLARDLDLRGDGGAPLGWRRPMAVARSTRRSVWHVALYASCLGPSVPGWERASE